MTGSPSLQFWAPPLRLSPDRVIDWARKVESDGWDGIGFSDTQCLAPDPYVSLTAAAIATNHLLLETTVTNTVTRHPAVLANSIASIDALSKGRAVLGVGSGDSALAYIGLSPPSLGRFERSLSAIQRYLRTEQVPPDLLAGWTEKDGAGPVGGPARVESSLRWLAVDHHKVPVDVAASGPRVIALAARHADRVTFGLGADSTRLQWAIDLAMDARTKAGVDSDHWFLGATVIVVPGEDIQKARKLAAGSVAAHARMSVISGKTAAGSSARDQVVYESLRRTYDMGSHGAMQGAHTEGIPDEFIDNFAIVGPVAGCIERFRELIGLGINRFSVRLGSIDMPADERDRIYKAVTNTVIPALRG